MFSAHQPTTARLAQLLRNPEVASSNLAAGKLFGTSFTLPDMQPSTTADQGRPYPSSNYFSEDFVVCAGSVLFRADPYKREWQICILHSPRAGVRVLPKGRKDCGESLEDAALRETYEETGYRCEFFPCRMTTRAPLPHVNMVDEPRVVEGVVEAFAVTLRSLGETRGTKMIWWYVTRATDTARSDGTQTETEDFHSEFIEAEKAIEQLTFQDDREIASKALSLVIDTEKLRGE